MAPYRRVLGLSAVWYDALAIFFRNHREFGVVALYSMGLHCATWSLRCWVAALKLGVSVVDVIEERNK